MGELRSLIADLQTSNAPVQLPTLRTPALARRGVRLAAGGALVLLGAGIGWGLAGPGGKPFGPAPDPGALPDGVSATVLTPPRQLHSLGGLNGLLEQMRAKFGDTMGHRLVVYPDYASLDRPDPADRRRMLTYSYRGGWDDPSAGPAGSGDVAVDLGKFDTQAVVGVLRGAPETLNLKPAEVKSTYLIIEPARDPTTPGVVAISVYVSSEFGSGYIALDPGGNVKRINYP